MGFCFLRGQKLVLKGLYFYSRSYKDCSIIMSCTCTWQQRKANARALWITQGFFSDDSGFLFLILWKTCKLVFVRIGQYATPALHKNYTKLIQIKSPPPSFQFFVRKYLLQFWSLLQKGYLFLTNKSREPPFFPSPLKNEN